MFVLYMFCVICHEIGRRQGEIEVG